jgi:hypothetical protein
MHTRQRTRNLIYRRPRGFEQIETYLAGLEGDVGVADGRDEGYCGCGVWVGWWDLDV